MVRVGVQMENKGLRGVLQADLRAFLGAWKGEGGILRRLLSEGGEFSEFSG